MLLAFLPPEARLFPSVGMRHVASVLGGIVQELGEALRESQPSMRTPIAPAVWQLCLRNAGAVAKAPYRVRGDSAPKI
ncbi:MAG: hypothetical protein KME26_14425 [Oscillatoria princeps RMCB-10]|nr:hypothetical protein [Oscillatoria princeps RMCB-10]